MVMFQSMGCAQYEGNNIMNMIEASLVFLFITVFVLSFLSRQKRDDKPVKTHEFTLVFQLHEGEDGGDYIDRLFVAGCGDATISHGKKGFILLEFDRESTGFLQAISSAKRDVISAIPHAIIKTVCIGESKHL